MTETLADFFDVTLPVEDPLRTDLIDMIRARDSATPRHLQVELGPSEVGHPCLRKMAYGIMDVERCNPQYDPLPSIIGTATHKWLESAAKHANKMAGWERWLIETQVEVTPGLKGHCDLYDRQNATVIDWKVPGVRRFRMYKKEMSAVYEMQAMFYGRGFIRLGMPVNQVAIAMLPRGGTLSGMHLWKRDYDDEMVEVGLKRREAVIAMLDDFRCEIDPDRYQWFPIKPDDCMFCPWHKSDRKTGIQCNAKQ